MNKKTASELHAWFATVAEKLGADGDGHDRSVKIDGPDKYGSYRYSYGYHVETRYGLLTFHLDAEPGRLETVNVYAQFIHPEKLGQGKSPPLRSPRIHREVMVNGLLADTYNGKWNLYLGQSKIEQVKQEIAKMLDPAGLLTDLQDTGKVEV